MTRINTNVSSLIGRNNLGRANASLSTALTRLSTGLRINTGKDDPAGLIASENLRSDITSIKKAIANTDRANQVIATADSALGQVSSLLNDIRGLVTESANSGALSDDQIAANQLQIDSSLKALNRIAQTTTFQGRRLLDGSLDFQTAAGTDFNKLSALQINQANLGASGSVNIDINVSAAATKAAVEIGGIAATGTNTRATGAINLNDISAGDASTGIATLQFETVARVDSTAAITLAGGGTMALGIKDDSADASIRGAAGDLVTVEFVEVDFGVARGAGNNARATWDGTGNGTLTIEINNNGVAGAETMAVADIIDDLELDTDFTDNFEFAGAGNAGNFVLDDPTTALVDESDAFAGTPFSGGIDQETEETQIAITGVAGASSNISINFSVVNLDPIGAGNARAVGNATNGYTIQIDDDGDVTMDDILTAISSISEVASAAIADINGATAGTGQDAVTTDLFLGIPVSQTVTELEGGIDAGSPVGTDTINVTADGFGREGNVSVKFQTANASVVTSPTGVNASIDNDGNIVVSLLNTANAINVSDIVSAINGLEGFSAELDAASDGNGLVDATDTDTFPDTTTTPIELTGGDDLGGILKDAVIELSGSGSEVLNLKAGTTIASLVEQINLTSDATGIEASFTTNVATGMSTLKLESTTYGSKGVVGINVISEDADGTFKTGLGNVKARATGTDVQATVNGVAANGNGNKLSINTSTLELSTTVEAGFEGTSSFTITGGGANFQLGPDVVTNQQVRLGIGSVNTSALGGVSGLLYQLGQGEAADLATDPTKAASIVEEAINQVTSLRGRLGAFQRTSLETNKNALNDTLANLTDAESSIRDADFAEETANLTRSQILVQSGTRVLGIANQNPQNVLSLLG